MARAYLCGIVSSSCRNEGRNTRHREKFVNLKESILNPFLAVDFDYPVKISVSVKLQNQILS